MIEATVDTIKRLILTKMCTSKEGGPFFFSIVCSQVRLSAATSAGCGFASLRLPPCGARTARDYLKVGPHEMAQGIRGVGVIVIRDPVCPLGMIGNE